MAEYGLLRDAYWVRSWRGRQRSNPASIRGAGINHMSATNTYSPSDVH